LLSRCLFFNRNINPELPAIDEYTTITRTAIALEEKEEEINGKLIADQTRVIDRASTEECRLTVKSLA